MKLYSSAVITALKDKHDFKSLKSLGQNFLADYNIVNKIIESAEIGEEDLVIEIGPGMGVLTAEAAGRAAKVAAVEIDKKLLPILEEALSEYSNVEIINGDILKTDLNGIVERYKTEGCLIIGNLPYYITTPVIMKVLEEKVAVERMVVMLQKEVADRIRAKPGTKAYGAMSVAVNYYCGIRYIADVPREVFVPKPNVDSAVLRLDIRKKPPVTLVSEKTFFACVKAGFGQRRKTLLNSLTGVYGLNKGEVLEAILGASIDPGRRAETLEIGEFAALADSVYLKTGGGRGGHESN